MLPLTIVIRTVERLRARGFVYAAPAGHERGAAQFWMADDGAFCADTADGIQFGGDVRAYRVASAVCAALGGTFMVMDRPGMAHRPGICMCKLTRQHLFVRIGLWARN